MYIVAFFIMVGFFMSLYAALPVALMLFGWTAPGDHPIITLLVLFALSVGTVRRVSKE